MAFKTFKKPISKQSDRPIVKTPVAAPVESRSAIPEPLEVLDLGSADDFVVETCDEKEIKPLWESIAAPPPKPCKKCGSILFWSTISDEQNGLPPRCEKCDPPNRHVRRVMGAVLWTIPPATLADIERSCGR